MNQDWLISVSISIKGTAINRNKQRREVAYTLHVKCVSPKWYLLLFIGRDLLVMTTILSIISPQNVFHALHCALEAS